MTRPLLPTLTTERLILRALTSEDFPAFAAFHADPRLCAYLPGPLSAVESQAFFARITEHCIRHGVGLWALALKEDARFAGLCGLNIPSFNAPFTPCVEIGWRLGPDLWNRGLATEAAQAALNWGFSTRGLAEILAFTVPQNAPSRRVMEKLGMRRDEDGDFEHPALAPGHSLRPHVLYRLPRAVWQARRSPAS